MVSDDKTIVMYGLVVNNNAYVYSFAILSATPTVYVPAPINDTLVLKDYKSNMYYKLSRDGRYSTFNAVFSTTAINCISGVWLSVDSKHILLDGKYTLFAKYPGSSDYIINDDNYRVISLSSLPQACVPVTTLTISNVTKLTNGYFNGNYIYSSRYSNKILLLNWAGSGVGFNINGNSAITSTYIIGSSSVQTTQLVVPQVPSSIADIQSSSFLYPVSVKSEFDFWIAQINTQGNWGSCYLVSTTISSLYIKIPGISLT